MALIVVPVRTLPPSVWRGSKTPLLLVDQVHQVHHLCNTIFNLKPCSTSTPFLKHVTHFATFFLANDDCEEAPTGIKKSEMMHKTNNNKEKDLHNHS
jgi:hypothetical protein